MKDARCHVCHVTTTFLHRAGSAQRTYRILRRSVEEGYRVTLVAGRDYGPHADWDLSGIDVIQLSALVKHVDPRNDLLALWKLGSTFRRLRPHAVHTHLAKAGVLGRLAATAAGVPQIFHTVHGPTFPESHARIKRALYLGLEKVAGRATTRFVFVGEELRNEYVRSGVASAERCVVVRTGQPDEKMPERLEREYPSPAAIREAEGVPETDFLLIHVGRLVPVKQQHHSIRALSALRKSGISARLWIVGEALLEEEQGYRRDLEALSQDLEVDDRVAFLGHRKDAMRLIRGADVLVLTSKYEGLPNVLVEAGLASRPAVTFRVCGAEEVVEDGVTGFVVDGDGQRALVARLAALAGDATLRARMGRAASRRVAARYRLSTTLDAKMAFYRRELGGPHGCGGGAS